MEIARERAKEAVPMESTDENIVPYRVTMADFRIPVRYRDCSFENFKGNDPLVKRVRAPMENGDSITLIGNTGCGKTHLAISALRYGIDTGRILLGAIFIPVPELLLKIRATFRNGANETEEDVIDRYSHCPFLILDDLGAEKTSEFSIATLELILDRRIRDNRPMIITTNLTLEEIEGKLSARIASRLAVTNCIKINMPDWRKRR